MLPIIARHRQQSRLVVRLGQKAAVLLRPVFQSQCFRQLVAIANDYGRMAILEYHLSVLLAEVCHSLMLCVTGQSLLLGEKQGS